MRLIREIRGRGRARLLVLLAPELGRTKLRFAFPKRTETLQAAAERLCDDHARARLRSEAWWLTRQRV